jgi:hypothetical protein
MGSDPMVCAQYSGIRQRGFLRFSPVNSTTTTTTTAFFFSLKAMSSSPLTAAECKAALLDAHQEQDRIEQEVKEAEERHWEEERAREKELLKELEKLEHLEEEERKEKEEAE